jgi:hypothetical protein
VTFDRVDAYYVRLEVARREPWRDVSILSDDELVDEWLREPERADPWGESWVQRAELGGTAFGVTQAPAEPEIEDLAPQHFVAFEVLDGEGDPYPDLGYLLRGPDAEVEEGTLSGPLRREGVANDDYHLTIKTVDALDWGVDATMCAHEVALCGRVTGHADGTEVEIRVFRELRETDDDVIATVTATVEGGLVSASWTYEMGTIAGARAQLRFIAELRVGGVPGWAKTVRPLVVELPAIRAARWSERRVGPGQPLEIRAEVVGIAEGSTMTVEVFKQRRDGAQECLETFEGLAVTQSAVVVPWAFEADVEDATMITEAECFFVATSEEHLDATRTSGPLWISRTVPTHA